MSTMKWTDEAISLQLALFAGKAALKPDEQCYRSALLELKRMRAWVKYMLNTPEIEFGHEYCGALINVLSGDPAPTDEQEDKR